MQLVFADTYLGKLWTVYELATRILLDAGRPICVQPPIVAKFVVGMSLCGWIHRAFLQKMYELVWRHAQISQSLSGIILDQVITIFSREFIMVSVLRLWARQQELIVERARGFDASSAQCFRESDRSFVVAGIVALMKDTRRCSQDAISSANG